METTPEEILEKGTTRGNKLKVLHRETGVPPGFRGGKHRNI